MQNSQNIHFHVFYTKTKEHFMLLASHFIQGYHRVPFFWEVIGTHRNQAESEKCRQAPHIYICHNCTKTFYTSSIFVVVATNRTVAAGHSVLASESGCQAPLSCSTRLPPTLLFYGSIYLGDFLCAFAFGCLLLPLEA